MKKRLVAFAVFAAITASVFAYGCNDSANVKKIADLSYVFSEAESVPAKIGLEELSGYSYEKGNDNGSFLFRKTETTISGGKTVTVTRRKGYNVFTDRIFDLPESKADISEGTGVFVECGLYEYSCATAGKQREYCATAVTVNKITLKNGALGTEKTLCVFDAAGNKITEFTAEEYAREVAYAGSVKLRGGSSYFLAGDRAFFAEENGALSAFENYDPKIGVAEDAVHTGGIKASVKDGAIIVYNDDYSVKRVYNLPDTAIKPFVSFLSDGTAFVQYRTVVGAETNDYDFVTDGIKYKLTTGKLSLGSGELKKKSAAFAVENIIGRTGAYDMISGLPGEIENVIFYYPIKDKKIDLGNYVIAEMDNDFNLKRRFNGFAGCPGIPLYAGNGRFTAEDAVDNIYYVLDNAGNVVASESSEILRDPETNGKFFLSEENVFYIKDGKFLKSEYTERGDEFVLAGDGVIAKRVENGENAYYFIDENGCRDTGAYYAGEEGNWYYLCKRAAGSDAGYEVYKKDGGEVLKFTVKDGQNVRATISYSYRIGAYIVGYETEAGYRRFIYTEDGEKIAEAEELNMIGGSTGFALFEYKNADGSGYFAVKKGGLIW